jgi:signal transduction histidine kinase
LFKRLVSAQTNGADPLLIRSNKLDLLERMADDLAHEIKNPLHSMVINLEVLKRRISRAEASGSSDMLRYADVLARELERVSHRVDLLLRMVRPGRGLDAVFVHELLDELRELVEVEAVRRSVKLHYEPYSAGGRLSLPRESARQVILNLIVTVLDAVAPGGQLQLAVEQVDGETQVRVTGIPAEGKQLATTAELAAAVPGTTAPEGGLAVARRISEMLGGRVEAVSSRDALSLCFLLPAP